tara:strand:+ start:127 stop:249 length:123 start_codon:yes stop_codon:yes gene_type:complete
MKKTAKGGEYVIGTPKKTTQGNGKHSRPKKNSKEYRGQGK